MAPAFRRDLVMSKLSRRATVDANACPCSSGVVYANCCEPLHQGALAADAEQLMRARYSAYVLQCEDYLLTTWHPSTRPIRLQLAAQQPAPIWLGLQVRRHISAGDQATVEFVARLRQGQARATRLHELSRFVYEEGRWFYLSGDLQT